MRTGSPTTRCKHSFEKVGDHWEPKAKKGPVRFRGRAAADPTRRATSAEGVDANASKKHLMDVARRLDISGRSTMSKDELVSRDQEGQPARVSSRSR